MGRAMNLRCSASQESLDKCLELAREIERHQAQVRALALIAVGLCAIFALAVVRLWVR